MFRYTLPSRINSKGSCFLMKRCVKIRNRKQIQKLTCLANIKNSPFYFPLKLRSFVCKIRAFLKRKHKFSGIRLSAKYLDPF